jgi:hypothetical protein
MVRKMSTCHSRKWTHVRGRVSQFFSIFERFLTCSASLRDNLVTEFSQKLCDCKTGCGKGERDMIKGGLLSKDCLKVRESPSLVVVNTGETFDGEEFWQNCLANCTNVKWVSIFPRISAKCPSRNSRSFTVQ